MFLSVDPLGLVAKMLTSVLQTTIVELYAYAGSYLIE